MNVADQLGALLAEKNLSLVIFAMALVLSRILPVIILSPFLGGESVPGQVKIGLGVMLALVLFPAVEGQVTSLPTGALPYIALMLKEIFIGMSLAFVVSMVTDAAMIAGQMVDTMSGAAMASVMVPQIQQSVTLFSSLKVQLTIVLFLTVNGHHMVIEALADSFLMVPLVEFPAFSGGTWAFFDLMIRVFGDMVRLGLVLAAPMFMATFLTDLSLGMINKVAPQVQVFFISMSIKPMITVLMAFIALHLIADRLVLEFRTMLDVFQRAVRILS